MWIVIPFVAFGVMAGRNVWPAVMVLMPIAVKALPPGGGAKTPRRESAVLNVAFAVVLLAVGVLGVTREAPLSQERFPSDAAVGALGPGRAFADTAVGGYLIYAEWPDRSVFIDDRAELYGPEGLEQFHDIKAGAGVAELFESLDIEQAVVRADWPLAELLGILEWEPTYEDEFFVVLSK